MDHNINLSTATEELNAIATPAVACLFAAARPAGHDEILAWRILTDRASMVFIPPG
jgi:hypothetical protein